MTIPFLVEEVHMVRRHDIKPNHPLRKLFKRALDFGLRANPQSKPEAGQYIEDQILCGFIHIDNLYKIRDAAGRKLDDIADMLSEIGPASEPDDERGFLVHKYIGDYTLFMLGMFPTALLGRKGKEFILGGLVVPGSSLFEHYQIQGERSYGLAAEFTHGDIFRELSKNFHLYRNVLELTRMFLESTRNREFLRARRIILE